MRDSSRNSLLSSSMYIMMSVPRPSLSASVISYSGLPSQLHLMAVAPSLYDFVTISTRFDTMNDE
jgi:hypothetical protein